ncbi:FAD-dependent oxidoreductase [Brevibacillus humidisoli]|uniref:FAD-dependent oxidoreductase n=1 Tax=Brevibacillus humidisoli TaxID=2895522 RepID=UPI001E564016|nr:FAD-dependent oxidoreductase [Brevibacillus humidisoli]UFJ39030.1 FAD-dependent oxidoreductase [Brevibacillus humidisoli]
MKTDEMTNTVKTTSVETDVVIVGAGPAGTVLAYLLARSGVRTILLERHSSLEREFRGYAFQPLVLKMFDQMGLLADLLRLEHHRADAFHFVDRGKELFSVRFDELPQPYNYALLMSQPLLLRFLIEQASRYDTFSFWSGTTARRLFRQGKEVAGVAVRRGEQEVAIRARLVVGADGRYSTIRKLAGIEQEDQPIPYDFLWFDLPGGTFDHTFPLQISIEEGGMLIYIPKGPDLVQVGWVIEKGSYPDLRKRGIDAFRHQLATVAPELTQMLSKHLTDFKQVSVLDIQVSMAQQWCQDGLLLIGDAAHVASPFSGQGNSLAIQDAVAAHPRIVTALKEQHGLISASRLQAFEEYRRPAVSAITRIQQMQARLIGINHPLLVRLRRILLPLVSKTPLLRRMREQLAMGAQPIHVASEYFVRSES